jgi:hypothetical protein
MLDSLRHDCSQWNIANLLRKPKKHWPRVTDGRSARRRERIRSAVASKAGRVQIEPDEYCRLAAASESELLSIVEEADSGETYFFREPGQFAFLKQEILPETIASCIAVRRPGNRLRVWSAACSTAKKPIQSPSHSTRSSRPSLTIASMSLRPMSEMARSSKQLARVTPRLLCGWRTKRHAIVILKSQTTTML